MQDTSISTAQVLSMLAALPARLADLSAGLSEEQLTAPPAPGEWSARDILAHLRACSDMWGGYIMRILNEDHPTIKAVNPRTWIKKTNYLTLEFRPSLQAYATQRAALLAVLTPLPAESWSRSATVTGAGKPLEKSVYSYAEWLASHERSHTRQIVGILNGLRGTEQQASTH